MKIAIARYDGIGDLILTLPMASAIKRHIPTARVVFVVSGYQAPLLEHHPDVDEYRSVPVEHGVPNLTELASVLREVQPDWLIDVLPRWKTAWLYYRLKIPNRVGTAFRWWSLLYNKRVFMRKHCSIKHEAEYNLELLRPLGIRKPQLAPPELFLTEDEIAWGVEFLSHLKKTRVVVHPGSHGTSPNWPVDKYVKLVDLLVQSGFCVILTGSRRERVKLGQKFSRLAAERCVLDTMGRLELRQLMAIIKASDVVVSCGTGVMHIAAAFGVPTVSLFGTEPTVGPERWGPLGNNSMVLQPVDKVTPNDVMDAVIEMISVFKPFLSRA